MFKNYLVIALRNIRRNPLYSFINIFGLSLGIACCLILASMVLAMISMNRSLPDAEQLYQLGRIIESKAGKNSQSFHCCPVNFHINAI